MPCCLLVITAFFPRVALIVMWLTGYAGAAYESIILPLLGFFFAPYTTCAYAIAQNETVGVQGWTLVLMIIAVLLDVGHLGGGVDHQRRRAKQRT